MREESIRKDDYTIYDVGFNFPRFTAWSVFETGIVKMNNSIITFSFKQNIVRTQAIDGKAWFCLKDACVALGICSGRDSKTRLNENGVGKTDVIDKMGRKQEITIINEPNLYRLIFRSNKPQAQAFADWVYEEVLPSIRKTGAYAVAGKPVTVAEHTRSLPSGKREIVLSEKAKQEIGGIVKAVVAKTLADFFAPDAEQHPSGMPFANWALSAVHDIGAMKSEYDALKNRVAQAQNILK